MRGSVRDRWERFKKQMGFASEWIGEWVWSVVFGWIPIDEDGEDDLPAY